MACALLQHLDPGPQMTGCQVRIAERHLDGGMARQGRDFREGLSCLHQAADEGLESQFGL